MAITFISYESSDKSTAFKICEYLESHGMKCWIAPRDIHAGEYAGEITRALKSAGNLVVVCSARTSKSPHVRNEVSLAFGDRCRIIPFMVDNVTLDDSLEYYFAGKQRVIVDGNLEKGLQYLFEVLGGDPIQSEPLEKKRNISAVSFGAAVILIAGLYAIFLLKPNAGEKTVQPASSPKNVEATIEKSIIVPGAKTSTGPCSSPKKETVISNDNLDLFSGAIRAGYPDGYGTYTFRKARRIDMHDSKAREANRDDYIIGEWENGHLIQGKWYSADGSLIEVLLIGKAPNPEADHIFGKCVNR